MKNQGVVQFNGRMLSSTSVVQNQTLGAVRVSVSFLLRTHECTLEPSKVMERHLFAMGQGMPF